MYSPYFPKLIEPEDVIRFLDEESKKVLLEFPYDGYCTSIKTISVYTGIHIEIVRMIIIELKKLGLISLRYISREDEMILCGSSYYLTPLGVKVGELICPDFDNRMRLP